MIYVVDDDASVRKAITRLLKSAGLSAQAFQSAEDLLRVVKAESPDCLLLDIQMPEMNGLELQRELTQSGIRIPVIFITAFDDDQTRQQAREAGAAGYFCKPFDDEALLDTIKFAVGKTGH